MQKWQAQIQINYKVINIGYYDTPEAGHADYCKAANELHGAFANVG